MEKSIILTGILIPKGTRMSWEPAHLEQVKKEYAEKGIKIKHKINGHPKFVYEK